MLVVVEDGGGLANRLFVFANVIVTGLATGHRVVNPSFRRWAESFQGTRGDSLSFFPRRRRATLGGPGPARVATSLSYRLTKLLNGTVSLGPLRAISLQWPEQCDLDDTETAEDIRLRRLVLLKGWLFRNASGVHCHAALLREFFRPVAAIRHDAGNVFEAARERGDFVIGVHVRHRDYRDFEGGRYFYPFPAYAKLMAFVAATVAPRRASFLVCSDEVQEQSAAGALEVTHSNMGPVHDLWALSRCDLIMGPPSTFSTWAAFLGEKPLWILEDSQSKPEPRTWRVPLPVPNPPRRVNA